MSNTPTPHNQAKLGEIAKTVLLPGDPLRAKFIADNFLTDVKQFNSVRNMLGFTGYYKGKKVSVMGSGMGMPSLGIYVSELYKFYGVETVIRIGSAGAYSADCKLFDLVIAQGASSDSNFAHQFNLPGTLSALGDFNLIEKAYNKAKELVASIDNSKSSYDKLVWIYDYIVNNVSYVDDVSSYLEVSPRYI